MVRFTAKTYLHDKFQQNIAVIKIYSLIINLHERIEAHTELNWGKEKTCNERSATNPTDITVLLNSNSNRMQGSLYHRVWKFFSERSLIVDLLVTLFGIGTWIGINGTFMQMPLLVETAPESWALPSYLTVIIQIGNLGPLAYTIIQHYYKINDSYLIHGLLCLATLSAIFTAFFYDKTMVLFGKNHSIALFILTFLTALNACTSSVLFMPYMGRFKETYMITFLIAEGLSGLIPSTIALIQGVGGIPQCRLINASTGVEIYEKYTPPPLFNTKLFFIFIFILMVLSFIGFMLLDCLQLCKKQYAAVTVTHGNQYVYETDINNGISNETNETNKTKLIMKLSSNQYVLVLCLMGIINLFSNGIVNSIQSYFCLPYGNEAYHLSATLSVIANPVACFFALFLPHKSLRSIYILTILASLLTMYAIIFATLSPLPPMHDTTIGAVIVVFVWTALVAMVSYVKLSITSVMRSQGGKSLVLTGSLSQFGSFIGSVIIFILINFTNIFKAAEEKTC